MFRPYNWINIRRRIKTTSRRQKVRIMLYTWIIRSNNFHFLGAIEKLRKTTISRHVCPCVRM